MCYIVCIPELVQKEVERRTSVLATWGCLHNFGRLNLPAGSGELLKATSEIDLLAESCYGFPIGFPCPRISVQAKNTGRVKMVGASPT